MRALRCAAAGLPVLAALAFAAPQAALAQLVGKLVGNTGETAVADTYMTPRNYAQKFTTGSSAEGYELTRVDIDITVAAGSTQLADYGMRITQVNSSSGSDVPGAQVGGNMTAAAGLSTGTRRYNAPGTGIQLAADTSYFVVFAASAWNNRRLVRVTSTASDDEDSGAAAGWSIDDSGLHKDSGPDAWADTGGNSHRIAIYGYASDSTPPTLSTASVWGAEMLLTYDEALNTTATTAMPAASAFSVTVDGSEVTVSSVEIAGPVVTLTLATAVTAGQTVTVSYTVPTSQTAGRIRDLQLNSALSFTDEDVTVADVTPPAIVPPDRTAWTGSRGEGSEIFLIFGEPLDGSSTPMASDFTVESPSGTAITVTSVDVTGSTVTLTLASALPGFGSDIDVTYTAGTNPIQDVAGNATTFTGFTTFVDDRTAPAPVSAATTATGLDVNFDRQLAAATLLTSSFNVKVDGSTVAISAAAIENGLLRITLDAPVSNVDRTVTVSYLRPDSDSNRLQDARPNYAASFADFSVTVVDAVAPVLSAATVDGTRLTLAYNEPLDTGSQPAATAYSVTVAGSAASPSSVSITGSAVILTLATAVTTGQTVTLGYTVPGTNPVRDTSGNAAAALTDQSVTEQSADATLSALAATESDGTALTLDPATFASMTYAYSTRLADGATLAKVTATTTDMGASLSGSLPPTSQGGSPTMVSMTSGTAADVSLMQGRNVLTVTVTAADGVAKQDYMLTLTVPAPPTVSISQVPADIPAGVGWTFMATGNDPDGGDVTYVWMVTDSGDNDVTSSVLTGADTAMPTFTSATPGDYTVTVTATDDDTPAGTATDTLMVTVGSAPTADNATLRALSVAHGVNAAPLALDQGFTFSGRDYTVTVANGVTSVTVTAATTHPDASAAGSLTTADGVNLDLPLSSGTASVTGLGEGRNVLAITVTAADGATMEDYTLTIIRQGPPMASISPSGAATVGRGGARTLDGSASEDPDGGTLTYAWTAADSNGADVTDDVFPNGANAATAVFTTTASTALGIYTVTLTVTDDEGETGAGTLLVTVAMLSGDATLMALTAMGGGAALTLSPSFASATTEYTATVNDAVNSVAVTATANHAAAALEGSLTRAGGTAEDVAMTGGMATLANLPPGDSVLTITVTAEDTTTQAYMLTIMRKLMPTVSISPAGNQRVAPETDLMLTATGNDPDGLAAGASLTYAWTAVASDPAMTETVLSAANTASVTFNAMMPGSWTVTVTVTDDEMDTATASLTVRVGLDTEMRAKAVTKVLAAAGVRTLSGALANVGARLGGAPGPSLTLAGENVPLGAASSSGLACEPDVFGRDDCAPNMRSASALDLFSSSAFTLAAGATGEAAADPAAPRWAVWGRGDAGAFEGSPDGMSYDGKTLTGWLGVDARAGRWVAGVALSRGETEADYEFDAGGGETGAGSLETTLTSVYPYGRWTFDEGYEVRGMVGAGTGEARHRSKEEGAAEETSDLTMWMASAGVRRPLPPTAGIALAARGELSVVQMETGDGEETIDGLSAQGWRGRAGVEGSQRFALPEGGSVEPFAEAGVRYDGGDGLEGAGVELAGGVRYNVERVNVEVRGRWLAAHTEEGAKERGLSATVRLDADALRRGFSFALTPRWGSSAAGSGALWKDDLPRPATAAAETSVDARLGYGVGMPRDALLTPFLETGLAEHRQYRVGARYEARRALSLELSGERRERTAAEPEHAVGLDLRLRF